MTARSATLPRKALRDIAPATMTPEERFAARVPYGMRKQRGQFFTPPAVARAMATWVCKTDPRSLLDPSCGPGIFLEAVAGSENRSVRRVQAIDVDSDAMALARARIPADRMGRVRWRCEDFLTADFEEHFDAIICNPPYVRHHDARLADSVFEQIGRPFGVRLSRMTNIYGLFLLKISSLLSPTGRAAVITPTEFLNADFGEAIKQVLLAHPALRGFVMIDARHSVFDGLLTTATITLLDARPEASIHRPRAVVFTHISTTAALSAALDHVHDAGAPDSANAIEAVDSGMARVVIARDRLNKAEKWSHIISDGTLRLPGPRAPHPRTHQAAPHNPGLLPWTKSSGAPAFRPLSDFASCMRGIATGANDYFTLTRCEAESWRLPAQLLRACLTKAVHAPRPSFDRQDWQGLADRGKKCWILDAPQSAKGLPGVREYLAHGRSTAVHERYLTRHRPTWHAIERRLPADLLVGVFSRGRVRFIRNAAGVLCLTAFHHVYLKPSYQTFLGLLACWFHSTPGGDAIRRETRIYGDGLQKFEPRDVERLLTPDLDAVSAPRLQAADEMALELWQLPDSSLPASLVRRLDALFADEH